MANRIGIRLEDKNAWERRAALAPEAVATLTGQGLELWVERFARRAFADQAYAEAGARLCGDVRDCELVLGIKEMPVDYFRPGGAYMFFSHTIKGQPHNMAMLRSLATRGCTLLDYEAVKDERGRRLIFFGRYAGLAGMIDTLWTLGQRLKALGHETPFAALRPAHGYADLEAAKLAVEQVGEQIARRGLPEPLRPVVVGITGYGNVSQGAQEILELLPYSEVSPDELKEFVAENGGLGSRLVKVVYKEEHLVEPIDQTARFDLQDYYDHGERYRSRFSPQLELLTVLVNGIFWAPRYPKLADAAQLRALFAGPTPPKLLVVGDITCDVDGSLACTVRDTEPGDPVYVYDPITRKAPSGFAGPGLSVMAVGNLPCELPREATEMFSEALSPFVPALARADLSGAFEAAALPDPIRGSVILWRGKLTPAFAHMEAFLR
jgi:alanine dehydrogenase